MVQPNHGYRLGEKNTFAKHCLWEEATKVQLIFAGPGILKGKMIDEPAELLSLYPTLTELCKMESYGKKRKGKAYDSEFKITYHANFACNDSPPFCSSASQPLKL